MSAEPTSMAREIAETGAAAARQLAANAPLTAAAAALLKERDPRLVITIARGSSDHAALYLAYLIEIALGLPCASIGPSIASLYRAPLRLEGALAMTISQSGRSPDIIALQGAAARAGALTLALVNDVDSPVAHEAECVLPLHAGPEKAVAATKSMIAALVAGAALVARWVDDRPLAAAIEALPALLAAPEAPPPRALVELIAGANSAFVLGRGATYPIAAEAALKLKETCAIHAEAFSSAEVLHGPAGVIAPGFLVIVFMPQDEARQGIGETLARLSEMGAELFIIDAAASAAKAALVTPRADHHLLTPIVMLHRFYALVEACARARGRDPDNPPHLSKITETK
jgi:glucosamine--fructose-6-phosphate aminotransferase (isomerizing)